MAASGSKSMPRMQDNQKNDKRGEMTVTRCKGGRQKRMLSPRTGLNGGERERERANNAG